MMFRPIIDPLKLDLQRFVGTLSTNCGGTILAVTLGLLGFVRAWSAIEL
jgi:hypothetical protein